MKIRTSIKLAGEGMANLRARSGMGFTAITIITLAFVVLCLFMLLFVNLSSLDSTLSERMQLRVFLTDHANLSGVEESLLSLPGVIGSTFIPKAQALENLKDQLGNRSDLLDLVKTNPLPHTYVIRVQEAHDIPLVAEKAQRIPGVDEVVYGKESLGKLVDFVETVRLLSIIGMGIIFVATLFIIVNTIRLTVIARRQEIEIRKLVGATTGFIRAPFLFEGIYMGVASASFASLAGYLLYAFILERTPQAIPFLPILPRQEVMPQVVWTMLGLGLILGVVGSSLSLRKYLR